MIHLNISLNVDQVVEGMAEDMAEDMVTPNRSWIKQILVIRLKSRLKNCS